MDADVTAYAAAIGLELRNATGLAANTVAAHRLLWLAGQEYDTDRIIEALRGCGGRHDVHEPWAPKSGDIRVRVVPVHAAHMQSADSQGRGVRGPAGRSPGQLSALQLRPPCSRSSACQVVGNDPVALRPA
jgi:hypothetical protein